MRSLRLRKPSPALVIAVIALFVGLGGGAYAAKVGTNQLKAKSVTTGKIAGQAVTSGKIGPKAVTSAKIGPKAVREGKLANEAVTQKKMAEDSVGFLQIQNKSVATEKLSEGSVTTSKLSDDAVKSDELGQIIKVEETSPPAAAPAIDATADCPADTRVISGGFEVTGASLSPPIPTGDKRSNNGWEASAIAQSAGDTVTAYAYCLESSP